MATNDASKHPGTLSSEESSSEIRMGDYPISRRDTGYLDSMVDHRPGLSGVPFGRVERLVGWTMTHWLLVANISVVLILAGAVVAPALRAAGLDAIAWPIHMFYRLLCLQRPSHSYFLLGHQLALEHRMLALFTAQLIGGLVYAIGRRPRGWLTWRVVLVLSLPMAVDIVSQMVGLRDSDWLTRTWTGSLAALPLVLWVYPHLDQQLPDEQRHGYPDDRGAG